MLWPLAGAALSVILAGSALRLGLFDVRGSFLAGGVGIAVVALSGDIRWLLLLVLFVVLGTLATKFALTWKSREGLSEGAEGSRSGRNVLANGGVPLAIVVLLGIGAAPGDVLVAAYAGAISTATADTLSSEIGVLSGTTRLITKPWKRVRPGVDGGISLLGMTWALVGSGLIGFSCAAMFGPSYSVPVFAGGFLGCQVDSLVGAEVERRGLINNEGVNLLATATGAIIALLLYA